MRRPTSPFQIVYLEVAAPRGVVTLKAAGTLHAEVQSFVDTQLKLACQLSDLDIDGGGFVA